MSGQIMLLCASFDCGMHHHPGQILYWHVANHLSWLNHVIVAKMLTCCMLCPTSRHGVYMDITYHHFGSAGPAPISVPKRCMRDVHISSMTALGAQHLCQLTALHMADIHALAHHSGHVTAVSCIMTVSVGAPH